MARMKTLVLFACVLVLAGVVYWQGTFNPPARVSAPRASLQLQPPAPTPRNNVATMSAAPSNTVAAPLPVPAAPSKDDASPEPVKKDASRVIAKKTPSRTERRDAPAAAPAERREPVPVARDINVAPAPSTTYQRRVADAAASEDPDQALAELQRLAAAEPDRPQAYEAMAGISLRRRDYAQAREQIASALAHGGKATFTLIHDHSRGNFESDDPKATCIGELTILADELKFEAPGDGDRFAAGWNDVRDAGSNRFFGSGIGGFHVAISSGGKFKNINFAPGSKDKAEARLILDLLTNYRRRADRTK